MFIRDDEAKYIIKVSIGDLMRKMGVVKESLNTTVEEKLWASLEELNTKQLQKLETKLKTLNMETNEWHLLYNENMKINRLTDFYVSDAKSFSERRDEVIQLYMEKYDGGEGSTE